MHEKVFNDLVGLGYKVFTLMLISVPVTIPVNYDEVMFNKVLVFDLVFFLLETRLTSCSDFVDGTKGILHAGGKVTLSEQIYLNQVSTGCSCSEIENLLGED